MSAPVAALARSGVTAWLVAIGSGALLGLALALGIQLGLWPAPSARLGALVSTLTDRVGPVWVPMVLVGGRVAWLGVRAWRTRGGHGALGLPVRPELHQLAPLFAALGLAGTVFGLGSAFDALGGGEFLARLPALLAGLGAAMTSTLVGLCLQIGTLLLAAFNPAWSRVRVRALPSGTRYEFDGVVLGQGDEGLARLLAALQARRPEALRVESGLRGPECDDLLAQLWERTDCAIPIRRVAL